MKQELSRRDFLKMLGVASMGAVSGSLVQADSLSGVPGSDTQNVLETPQPLRFKTEFPKDAVQNTQGFLHKLSSDLNFQFNQDEVEQLAELAQNYPPIFLPVTNNESLGFHLEGPIRETWRAHSHGLVLGKPISEAIPQGNGTAIQYFEKAGIELNLESGEVNFLPLGRQFLEASGSIYDDYLVADGEEPESVNRYFRLIHGGESAFGSALTRPIQAENGLRFQVYENMVLYEYDRIEVPDFLQTTYEEYYYPKKQLEWNRGRSPLLWPEETGTFPIGQILADNGLLQVTSPQLQRSDSLAYSPSLWSGEQTIYVDTNWMGQRLWATEGDLVIMEIPISTGRDDTGFFTPDTSAEGTSILRKIPMMNYRSPLEGEEYFVPNVPWNMSLAYEPEVFIHGIYWHPNFGRQASHGCINVTPMHAHWLYNWTTENTVVIARTDLNRSYGQIQTNDLVYRAESPPPFPLDD